MSICPHKIKFLNKTFWVTNTRSTVFSTGIDALENYWDILVCVRSHLFKFDRNHKKLLMNKEALWKCIPRNYHEICIEYGHILLKPHAPDLQWDIFSDCRVTAPPAYRFLSIAILTLTSPIGDRSGLTLCNRRFFCFTPYKFE